MPGQYLAKARQDGEHRPGELNQLSERTALIGKPLNGRMPTSKVEPDKVPTSLFSSPVQWLRDLEGSYSWRLLAMVVCSNHLLKGFVAGGGDGGLVGMPIEFIFSDMGLTAGRLQMLKAAAIAPWALKPVIALLSDGVPIVGYKKMPYVVITTLMSFCAALAVGFGYATTIPSVVACFFLIFLQVSTVDLLVEAKQSEEIKQKMRLGPQLFTFTWLGINMGQVGGVLLLGPLIHHYGPRVCFLVAAPFILLVLWPTLGNFLGERILPIEERGLNFKIAKKHPVLCSMTVMIGSCIMCLIFGTFYLSEIHVVSLALIFASLVMASFLIFIRHEIARPIVFYFMLGMLSFNIDGAIFYFYTNSPAEFPEGPHFTPLFYTSAIGLVTFFGIMTGFLTGDVLFKNWHYRGILAVTIVLRCFTQLCFVPAFLHWNRYLGIPDAVWILGCVAMDTMVFAWRWIPKQVMAAHLTPHGMEATMLGLSAGTFNMAMILSSYLGGFLLTRFGVMPSGQFGESHMFMNLWKVQVVAAFAPCVMLLFLPMLVPAKTQTEPLIAERLDSATHSSVFDVMMHGRRPNHQSYPRGRLP